MVTLIAISILILLIYIVLGYTKPALALVTLPIALIIPPMYVIEMMVPNWDMPYALVISISIFIITLLAIFISKEEPDGPAWPKKTAKIMLVFIVTILLVSTCIGMLIGAGIIFGPAAIYFFVFFIFFVASIFIFLSTSKQTMSTFIISTIGSSIRQNLPLPMALEQAAAGRKDKYAIILLKIKDWLVRGFPLSEAIKRGYPKCPSYALGIITAAEKINQLPNAFQAIENDLAEKAQEHRRLRPFHPSYPIVVALFMLLVISFLFKWVIPIYHDVLTEMFEGELPLSTRIIGEISDFIAFRYGWLFISIALILFLMIIPVWIRTRTRPRRPEKPYLISRITDFIKWKLPIFRWFEKNYSMVHSFEILRLSLNSGSTVNQAIAKTLKIDINNCFKKRLRRWLHKVEQGQKVSEAAKRCKLGPAFAWAFDDTINTNTLSILQMLENVYRSNYNFRINLTRFILGPSTVILMGFVVGFVVYACFIPYVSVIHHLCQSIVP
jgi:type II secretory pathway component PulF